MKLYYTTYDNEGTHCDKTILEKGYEELMFHVLSWLDVPFFLYSRNKQAL